MISVRLRRPSQTLPGALLSNRTETRLKDRVSEALETTGADWRVASDYIVVFVIDVDLMAVCVWPTWMSEWRTVGVCSRDREYTERLISRHRYRHAHTGTYARARTHATHTDTHTRRQRYTHTRMHARSQTGGCTDRRTDGGRMS